MSSFSRHRIAADTDTNTVSDTAKRQRWAHFWREKREKYITKTWLLRIGGGVLALGIISFLWILSGVPGIEEIRNINFAENTVIYDASGEHVLYNIHGEENRRYVALADIAPDMGRAILAAEDADFYAHQGVDFSGVLRSVYYLLRTGEIHGGGSTLTQQFARNSLLTTDQTLIRKLREIYLSFRLEGNFSKDEILEMYLNKVSFGNNAYGIEQAAQTYFDKSARDLTLAESIVLAAIPQAPTRWSPYGPNKESSLNFTPEGLSSKNITTAKEFWALETEDFSPVKRGLLGKTLEIAPGVTIYAPGRTDYVLDQLKEKEFISTLEYEKTKADLATIADNFKEYHEDIFAEHFVFYVRDLLEQQLGKEAVANSGLRVYTTLDYDAQAKAEELVKKYAAINDGYDVSNLALVASEPSTGQIKAMVGSRDYWSEEIDGKVNVILQRRQPGSSFKPITYAASFLHGLAPASVLFDVETKFGSTVPQNFDGTFRGPVSIRKALGNSLNIPALKAGILAGDGAVFDLAQKLGITFTQDADFYGASIAIGAAEAEPLEMLQAFSVFAAGGKKIPLTPILYVEDQNGEVVLDFRNPPEDPEQVLSPEVAYQVTDVLSDPEARGPGWNARLQLRGRKNAVKTGTSNAVDPQTGLKYPNDNWTNGFTPQLATVVWAGNNRGFVKNRRADGYNNAAPLWKEFMEFYHQDKPALEFERPEGIRSVAVDRFSGKLPPEGADGALIVTDIFAPENMPTETGAAIQLVEIDKVTGKRPTEFTPPDAIEKKAILNLHSERPDDPAWEIPVQNWLQANGGKFLEAFGVSSLVTTTTPTDSDTEHTAETARQKPSISILSPVGFSTVTPPELDVLPEVTARNGLRSIEIYWDDELKETLRSAPWQGRINIGSPATGSTHTLRVKAVDQLYYADESEITLKIGADSVAPQITPISPQAGERLSGGTLHVLSAQVVDSASTVSRVTFSLDGKLLASFTKAPFSFSWNAPSGNESYELEITAEDSAGNESNKKVSFSTGGSASAADRFGLIAPQSGETDSGRVEVSVGITAEQAKNLAALEIWSRASNGTQKIVHSFSDSDLSPSRTFVFIWDAIPGRYELWAKVTLSSGGSQISPKVNIQVP